MKRDNMTEKELVNHWENPENGKNDPRNYCGFVERSNFLYDELFKNIELNFDYNILELGCNCGRDLNYLYNKGFKNLTGIEINKNTIDYGKKIYNKSNINYINNRVEKVIESFKENEFDIVFSFVGLSQIHKSYYNFICEQIKKISKYIVLVEFETRKYDQLICVNDDFELIVSKKYNEYVKVRRKEENELIGLVLKKINK